MVDSSPGTFREWLLAARPKTLIAAVAPLMVATAVVKSYDYQVQWWIVLCAFLSAAFIQIGTNFINDAVDFIKGADTDTRHGPMRVTQKGYFTSKQVLIAGSVCFLMAVLLGAPLVWVGGPLILWIGLLSVFCGYIYTAGPYPLAYVGLGDLFVIVFFGLIAVGGVVYLQIGLWPEAAVLAGFQVGFLATVLIAINNFRDIHGDTAVGKKTFAVRLGPKLARWWIVFNLFMPFVLGFYWAFEGRLLGALLPLPLLALAAKIAQGVFENEPGPVFNRFLGLSALLQLLFCSLLSLGLVV